MSNANPVNSAAQGIRIALVDNWHDRWKDVLAMIDQLHGRCCLQLDEDGWLSARQNLLVAFVGARPVGFLCFRVEPMAGPAHAGGSGGKLLLAAVVEKTATVGDVDRPAVSRALLEKAMNRALELRCAKFLGHAHAEPKER